MLYKINKHEQRWLNEDLPQYQMGEAIKLEKKIYVVVGIKRNIDEVVYELCNIKEYIKNIKSYIILEYRKYYYTLAKLEEMEKEMSGGLQ